LAQSEAYAIVHALYRTIACKLPGSSKGPGAFGVLKISPKPARLCLKMPFRPEPFTVRVGAAGGEFLHHLFPSARYDVDSNEHGEG
jgi:hypothetical protein